jgi:hypothetical protein
VTNDAVDITGLYQAAEGRQLVEFIALGGKLRRRGFNDFGDFIRCLDINKPHPL